MRYKVSLPLLFLMTLNVVPVAVAQETEAWWRVVNEEPKGIPPIYEGDEPPFPYIAPPEEPEVAVQVIEPAPEVSPEETARLARQRRAADLLAQIRSIMQGEASFNPDVSRLEVKGIVVGQKKRALISDKWMKIGDSLKVPVQAREDILNLIGNLRSLDRDLAEETQGEVEGRIAELGSFNLKVQDIGKDSIALRDSFGKTHVIFFTKASW